MKLMPASSAAWMTATDSSWSGLPQAPNIIAPRQRGLTFTPVRPRVRYFIAASLSSSGRRYARERRPGTGGACRQRAAAQRSGAARQRASAREPGIPARNERANEQERVAASRVSRLATSEQTSRNERMSKNVAYERRRSGSGAARQRASAREPGIPARNERASEQERA